MTRTAAEIEREIARLKRVMRDWELEGRLDCEVEDEMQGEIMDLQDEMYAAEWDEAVAKLIDETPVSQKEAA